jgi:hypothetical protein
VKAIEEEEIAEKIAAAAAAAGSEKSRKHGIFYRGPRIDIMKMIAMLPVRRKVSASRSQVCEWWRKRLTVNSRVWSFFFGKSHMMEDPDAAISAMTLVCALTLTIPFSIMSYVDSTFFTELKSALSNCSTTGGSTKDSYDTVFHSMQQALWACIMCSIMGLTLSSVYYVFQPLPGKDLDGWCRNQGRVLFSSLIIVTMCAIVALLVLSSYLFTYYTVPTEDVCTYTAEYLFNPGTICLILTFVIALWCMW